MLFKIILKNDYLDFIQESVIFLFHKNLFSLKKINQLL